MSATLVFEERRNSKSPAAALGRGYDLMAPKFRPLFGGLDVFFSSTNDFVVAFGNFKQFGVPLVFIFYFHEGQDTGRGWTFAVQPSKKSRCLVGRRCRAATQ
jgi:hypothetical protein